MRDYDVIDSPGVPIKAWTRGVPVEDAALKQLKNVASLPFIHKHVAVMPDVHWGMGATVGSVIPTVGAIIPAAVGVDIGCGMMAVRTSIRAEHLPDDLSGIRSAIEAAGPTTGDATTRAPGRRSPRPRQSPAGPISRPAMTPWRRNTPRRRTPVASATWARWARATTSSSSASTKRATCG